MNQFFNEIPTASDPSKNASAKRFKGNGTTLLLVPGLLLLTAVSIGNVEIPLTRVDTVMVDTNGNTEEMDCPLVRLIQTTEGPALQRGVASNDGIWQEGATIVVQGKWANEPDTPTPLKTAEVTPSEQLPSAKVAREKILQDLKYHELKPIVDELGLKFEGKKEDVIAMILAAEFPE